MQQKLDSQDQNQQAGFALLDVLIAVTLLSLVIIAVTALTVIASNGLARASRKKEAQNYVVELSNQLRTRERQIMNEGGAFAVDPNNGMPVRDDNGEINLRCGANFCDRVIMLPATRDGETPRRKTIGWNDELPANSTALFVRAWTISDEDRVRGWRRVTIAVLPANSNIPLTASVTGGVVK